MNKYIAYYRVSTQKQGQSGLGLEAQKTTVRKFINGNDNLIVEYIEVESGKNNHRPKLIEAIELCRKENAKLLIAKLDRLSRNVAFIYTLMDSKVEFACCDMPNANEVTIGIMAVLAQDERSRISQRTKSALAELKAKGVKLGSPQNLTKEVREKGLETRKSNALDNENNRKASALILSLRNSGQSFGSIAKTLNENGFRTRHGNTFTQMQVKRLYERSNR